MPRGGDHREAGRRPPPWRRWPAVGISRQALYPHFPGRGQLLLALVGFVGEKEQLRGQASPPSSGPPTPSGTIRAFARLQAWRNPEIAAVARALDHTRHIDPAAAAAWADRMGDRMPGASYVIERLRGEGRRAGPGPGNHRGGSPLWS